MSTSEPPKFRTDEGNLTTDLVKVSSVQTQILEGELGSDVVDIQINLNGAGFQSDPDLVEFENQEFTIPNQNVLPSGLDLNFGKNTIEIRSVHSNGFVSNISRAEITIVRENEIDVLVEVPSGLRVRRQQDAVELVWSKNDDSAVKGYNVYASEDPGGGTTGYRKINRDLITESEFSEEETIDLASTDVTYETEFGVLHQIITEEDFNGNELQTVTNSFLNTEQASSEKIRVNTNVESVREQEFFTFVHNRNSGQEDGVINNEFFTDVPNDEPLFYVITAVATNPNTGEEIESPYSEELIGIPLSINTSITEVPRRTRFDVSEDYIDSIHQFNEEISLIPGSVSRDLFIDPFSSEAQRLYFLADFIRRSQSLPTLLQIDENESYKQALESALGLGPSSQIQNLIDDSFDKLAANVNVTRKEATNAVGDVLFYTNSEPETDLIVPEGTLVSTAQAEGETITFRVTSRQRIPAENADSFYNINRERWEISTRVQATEPGSQGNVSAGMITTIVGGGVSGLQVENTESTRFGKDEEGNQSLAERAMLAFSAVDSGTKQGYLSTALEQPGVLHAESVDAGHPLMMRDYDSVREEHIGGKVDVWIQGQNQKTVEDTFTMEFGVKENVEFFLDSNPSDLVFVTNDSDITPEQPITELLGETVEEQNQGFGFRNNTTGQDFDLSNYTIIDYNKIQLDNTISQPSLSVNDVVSGDVRFVQSTDYIFSNQPVNEVNSVESLDSDQVLEPDTHYDLVKTEDPLLQGRSTLADDHLSITQVNGTPSGDVFTINDETHVLTGERKKQLEKIGVNEGSIRVFTLDRSVEYDGPDASQPDFFIDEGDTTNPTSIYRNPQGDIQNGEEVSVDYTHDENFAASYTVNALLDEVQRELNNQRHITADVVAKETLNHELSLEMTVVLKSGVSPPQVDSNLKTRISQVVSSKGIGEALHQSDIVQAIENVEGVSHAIMPLTKMTHRDGNLILREPLDNVGSILNSTSNRETYILRESLSYSTRTGGGGDLKHRGVFEDTQPMKLVESYTQVKREVGRAMIIGDEGLIIPGFTDDSTLEGGNINTQEEIEEKRKELTANHVIVTLQEDDSPVNHEYSVSYVTDGNKGSRSTIEASSVSNLELGEISITYSQQ